MKKLLMGLVLMSAAAVGGHAQNVEGPYDINENVRPVAQSSGVSVAGVLLATDPEPIRFVPAPDDADQTEEGDRIEMALHLPPSWKTEGREFCVSTLGSDGLYDGHATYRLTNVSQAEDYQTTEYATHELQRIDGYGRSELAVLIRPDPCGPLSSDIGRSQTKPIEITVAYWRTPDRIDDDRDEIEILVNPLGAERVVLTLGNGIQEDDRIPCRPAEVTMPTAYSLVCSVARKRLLEESDGNGTVVGLQKITPGRLAETTWVRLFVPH